MQNEPHRSNDDSASSTRKLCTVCGGERPAGRLTDTCSTGCVLDLRSRGESPTRIVNGGI